MTTDEQAWWNTVTDRKFLKVIYKQVGIYLNDKETPKVLDIGVEYYNGICKSLIDNTDVEYWQLDPNKVSTSNDGFLYCTTEDALSKYPECKSKFDVIFDIGVLGWNGTRFSQKEQDVYIKNIVGLLKPNGVYILHGDRIEEDEEYKINFDKFIYPYFKVIEFMGYRSTVIIQCPKDGTIWDIRFLQRNNNEI
jgi:hypothetical protein